MRAGTGGTAGPLAALAPLRDRRRRASAREIALCGPATARAPALALLHSAEAGAGGRGGAISCRSAFLAPRADGAERAAGTVGAERAAGAVGGEAPPLRVNRPPSVERSTPPSQLPVDVLPVPASPMASPSLCRRGRAAALPTCIRARALTTSISEVVTARKTSPSVTRVLPSRRPAVSSSPQAPWPLSDGRRQSTQDEYWSYQSL